MLFAPSEMSGDGLWGRLVCAVLAVLTLVGCSSEPTCKANVGKPSNETQITGFVCSDDKTRAIECVPDGTKGPRCTCIADSVRGNEFQ